MLAVKRVVAVGPYNVAIEIDGHKTAIAETGINALTIGNWCGRRVAVSGFLLAGNLPDYFLVPDSCAGLGIDSHDPARLSLFCGRGKKDSIVPDDRGRP